MEVRLWGTSHSTVSYNLILTLGLVDLVFSFKRVSLIASEKSQQGLGAS
jgi:hypothetical protein